MFQLEPRSPCWVCLHYSYITVFESKHASTPHPATLRSSRACDTFALQYDLNCIRKNVCFNKSALEEDVAELASRGGDGDGVR